MFCKKITFFLCLVSCLWSADDEDLILGNLSALPDLILFDTVTNFMDSRSRMNLGLTCKMGTYLVENANPFPTWPAEKPERARRDFYNRTSTKKFRGMVESHPTQTRRVLMDVRPFEEFSSLCPLKEFVQSSLKRGRDDKDNKDDGPVHETVKRICLWSDPLADDGAHFDERMGSVETYLKSTFILAQVNRGNPENPFADTLRNAFETHKLPPAYALVPNVGFYLETIRPKSEIPEKPAPEETVPHPYFDYCNDFNGYVFYVNALGAKAKKLRENTQSEAKNNRNWAEGKKINDPRKAKKQLIKADAIERKGEEDAQAIEKKASLIDSWLQETYPADYFLYLVLRPEASPIEQIVDTLRTHPDYFNLTFRDPLGKDEAPQTFSIGGSIRGFGLSRLSLDSPDQWADQLRLFDRIASRVTHKNSVIEIISFLKQIEQRQNSNQFSNPDDFENMVHLMAALWRPEFETQYDLSSTDEMNIRLARFFSLVDSYPNWVVKEGTKNLAQISDQVIDWPRAASWGNSYDEEKTNSNFNYTVGLFSLYRDVLQNRLSSLTGHLLTIHRAFARGPALCPSETIPLLRMMADIPEHQLSEIVTDLVDFGDPESQFDYSKDLTKIILAFKTYTPGQREQLRMICQDIKMKRELKGSTMNIALGFILFPPQDFTTLHSYALSTTPQKVYGWHILSFLNRLVNVKDQEREPFAEIVSRYRDILLNSYEYGFFLDLLVESPPEERTEFSETFMDMYPKNKDSSGSNYVNFVVDLRKILPEQRLGYLKDLTRLNAKLCNSTLNLLTKITDEAEKNTLIDMTIRLGGIGLGMLMKVDPKNRESFTEELSRLINHFQLGTCSYGNGYKELIEKFQKIPPTNWRSSVDLIIELMADFIPDKEAYYARYRAEKALEICVSYTATQLREMIPVARRYFGTVVVSIYTLDKILTHLKDYHGRANWLEYISTIIRLFPDIPHDPKHAPEENTAEKKADAISLRLFFLKDCPLDSIVPYTEQIRRYFPQLSYSNQEQLLFQMKSRGYRVNLLPLMDFLHTRLDPKDEHIYTYIDSFMQFKPHQFQALWNFIQKTKISADFKPCGFSHFLKEAWKVPAKKRLTVARAVVELCKDQFGWQIVSHCFKHLSPHEGRNFGPYIRLFLSFKKSSFGNHFYENDLKDIFDKLMTIPEDQLLQLETDYLVIDPVDEKSHMVDSLFFTLSKLDQSTRNEMIQLFNGHAFPRNLNSGYYKKELIKFLLPLHPRMREWTLVTFEKSDYFENGVFHDYKGKEYFKEKGFPYGPDWIFLS